MAAHSELTPTEIADRLSLRELFDAYAHCADPRLSRGGIDLRAGHVVDPETLSIVRQTFAKTRRRRSRASELAGQVEQRQAGFFGSSSGSPAHLRDELAPKVGVVFVESAPERRYGA
jgi:hypothetical protein